MRIRRILTIALAGCWVAFASGCLSRQVAKDGMGFRQALLDMYTDQAMDNLIRARNNMPFVQVAYRNLLVQDTDRLTGKLDATQTVGASRDQTFATGVSAVVRRSLQNVYALGGSASRDRQMSFYADPITDKNDIYEAYLLFAHNPELLMVSDRKPTCNVHLMRKKDHQYYWIPVEAGPAFLDLVLRTAFMRGPETAPPAYYDVKIARIADKKDAGEGLISLFLVFNRKVPNGSATLVATLKDGRKVRLGLDRVVEAYKVDGKDVKPPAHGEEIDRLRAMWNPEAEGFTDLNLLESKAVHLYSHFFPPEAPTPDVAIQRVIDDLGRIRANQSLAP